MRILITSGGGGGTWAMRGQQMAEACGADCLQRPTAKQMADYDAIVAIKRIDDAMLAELRGSGRPWVWDIVDSYPQDTTWDQQTAVTWFASRLRHLRPHALIFPTWRMLHDCAGHGLTATCIPHHARPQYQPYSARPLSDRIKLVAYEGMSRYIEHWLPVIKAACATAGARFEVGRGALEQADAVLSLRNPPWHGYQMLNWKPWVKLANALALGLPFVGLRPDPRETPAGDWVIEASTPSDIPAALEHLAPVATRAVIRANTRTHVPTLDDCAQQLRRFVEASCTA